MISLSGREKIQLHPPLTMSAFLSFFLWLLWIDLVGGHYHYELLLKIVPFLYWILVHNFFTCRQSAGSSLACFSLWCLLFTMFDSSITNIYIIITQLNGWAWPEPWPKCPLCPKMSSLCRWNVYCGQGHTHIHTDINLSWRHLCLLSYYQLSGSKIKFRVIRISRSNSPSTYS